MPKFYGFNVRGADYPLQCVSCANLTATGSGKRDPRPFFISCVPVETDGQRACGNCARPLLRDGMADQLRTIGAAMLNCAGDKLIEPRYQWSVTETWARFADLGASNGYQDYEG